MYCWPHKNYQESRIIVRITAGVGKDLVNEMRYS